MAGVFLLGASDFHFSRDQLWGDIICFVSMLFYAIYLVFGRINKDLASIYLYIVPVYLLGGLFCLLVAIIVEATFTDLLWLGPNLKIELISILGLAIVPTLLGHTLINASFRHIRGQIVSIFNLTQFIFAGILGFLILGEIPLLSFYLASVLVVAGSVVTLTDTKTG